MKLKAQAITLLLILAAYLIRPVAPYIDYALHKKYIAKNLCENRDKPRSCCQGKCYLKKQLKKQSETAPFDRKDNNNRKIQENEVKEFLPAQSKNTQLFTSRVSVQNSNQTLYRFSITKAIFVPPKYAA